MDDKPAPLPAQTPDTFNQTKGGCHGESTEATEQAETTGSIGRILGREEAEEIYNQTATATGEHPAQSHTTKEKGSHGKPTA